MCSKRQEMIEFIYFNTPVNKVASLRGYIYELRNHTDLQISGMVECCFKYKESIRNKHKRRYGSKRRKRI